MRCPGLPGEPRLGIPARRFVAMALIADGRLTAPQIAELLVMPVRQVHHLASRAGLERLGLPLDGWLDAWSERKMGNG